MSLVYRYRTIDGRGSPIKRPMIDVEFINGSKRFTVKALLDSGADSCAISSDMATALGLDTGESVMVSADGADEETAMKMVEAYLTDK